MKRSEPHRLSWPLTCKTVEGQQACRVNPSGPEFNPPNPSPNPSGVFPSFPGYSWTSVFAVLFGLLGKSFAIVTKFSLKVYVLIPLNTFFGRNGLWKVNVRLIAFSISYKHGPRLRLHQKMTIKLRPLVMWWSMVRSGRSTNAAAPYYCCSDPHSVWSFMSASCSFLLLSLFCLMLNRLFTFDVKSAKPGDWSRRASWALKWSE